MTDLPSTRDRILAAAEALLRRHGPAKVTVVDVARQAGMSHANVYRHFASKTALQEAVAEAWLHAISEPLEAVVAADRPAPERLEAWVLALAEAKRRKVHDDPELFATYAGLAAQSRAVVTAHMATLHDQLRRILQSGAEAGDYRLKDPAGAAATVAQATLAFHHPDQVAAAGDADRSAAIRRLVGLLNAGLSAGAI